MSSNLSQVNVELLTIDKRTFTTDEGNSLQTLFGENSEGSAQYRAEVSTMAARLATVFASLKVGKPSVYTPSTLEGKSSVYMPSTYEGKVLVHPPSAPNPSGQIFGVHALDH